MVITNCKICEVNCEKDIRLYPHNSLITSGHCFDCAYWLDVLENNKENVSVRLNNGIHYSFPKDNPVSNTTNKRFLGHYGITYKIKFNDGSVVITNNLSFNGEIPERWKSKHPPNAKWMKLVKNK